MNDLELFVIGEIAMLDQLEAHLLVLYSKTQGQQRAIMTRIRRVQTHRKRLMNWQARQPNRSNA